MTNSKFDFPGSLHEFMRSNASMDDAGKAKLHELATYIRTDLWRPGTDDDLCLNSAVTYAQADKLAALVDQYGANVQQYTDLMDDNDPKKKVRENLLGNALMSFNLRPDVDRSPEGQKRLAQTVEFLLQRGVPAAPNSDPRKSAVAEAYALAHPDDESTTAGMWAAFSRSSDPDHAAMGGFKEPYELIRKYQPEAVARFERDMGLAADGTKLPLWKQAVNAVVPVFN